MYNHIGFLFTTTQEWHMKIPPNLSQMGGGDMHLQSKNDTSNSEGFYTTIFDSIGSPILIIDPQTAAILDVNTAACKFYGYSHADFIQKKILDLAAIPAEEVWQRIRKIAAGEITRMISSHHLASGELRDVEVDLGRNIFENKHVIIATIHDITEQKQAEQTLQANEKKYHGFVSQANEAFTLVNEQGVVIEWNPASEQLTGIPASEVLGQFVWDVQLRVTSPEQVTPEIRDMMRQRIQSVLETGSGPLLLGTYETEIKRADGKTIIVAQKLFTIKTAQGFQIGTIARDITQERQTQKDLKVSEERYRSLFENMREGFSLYEVLEDKNNTAIDARILTANAAYKLHTGLNPAEVIGKTILEVMPQTDLKQLEPYIKVAQTGEPISLEYFSTAFQRYYRTTTFCPQPGQFATIVEDITERKQAEQALRESEERFSTVFHSSHDSISIHRLTDDIFLDVNEAFSVIFGLTREQIIGHAGREFYTPLDPAEREEMMRSLRSQGQFIDFEAQFHNRQGQAGYLLLSGKIINVSGEECLLLFGKNITERKNADFLLQAVNTELEKRVQERTVELRRSLERLDLATDAAKMGIWDWDIQKDELVWDRQTYALYGVNPEDFSGAYEAWLGGVYPDDRQRSDEFAQRALRGEVTYDTEFRVLWPDGSTHWLKSNGQVFWDEQGEPVRMLGVNYDITERRVAELQLRESEERFRALFEKSAVTMLLIDPATGSIVNANPAAADFYGYSREQLCALNIKEINQLTSEEVTHEMQLAKENRRNYFIFPHRLANGTVRTVEVRSNPIAMGQSTLLFSFVYDITEKIETELQMRENQFRAEMAVRGANAGTWEWNVQTGETAFNQRWAEIVGYTLNELEPISIQTWINLCHPDDLNLSDELLEKHFTGQTESYECEVRMKHKDGSWVWVFDSGKVMDWTKEGKPLRMFGTHLNVTERKRAENALRESEERFSQAFHTGTVINSMIHADTGRFIDVNDYFLNLFEYRREQVIGHTYQELDMVADPAQTIEMLRQAHEQGYIHNYEVVLRTSSGKPVILLTSMKHFHIAGILYSISTSIDITERKQAELKLAETNTALEKALQVKDEFLAAMSHELRTPINGIMGMAELLHMTTADMLNDKQSNYLTVIEKSGQRLLDTVNNVLEYTQLQGGNVRANLRMCELEQVCRVALQKNDLQAKEKQQHVRYAITPPDIRILTDEVRLHKILSLLLDNASKFTAAGGEFGIEVTGRPDARLVDITVWDTGIGIAEENFPQLFKPFTQLDASLARQYEGTGLGLALVKSITDMLKGTVSVQSTLDKGSRFTITLMWK